MTSLTGRQKRFLRGMGQALRPAVVVGKEGATPGIVAAATEALSRRELIKIRVPPGPAAARKAMARNLASRSLAACVGVVGRTALLYRPGETLDAECRIRLPE